jgi:hypothetical protein
MRHFRFAHPAAVETSAAAFEVWVAERWLTRLVGLCGVRELSPRSGLLIPRCAWVHTFAMRFAIDLAFLQWPPAASRCAVLAVETSVGAGRSVRLAGRSRGATAVLEVPAQASFSAGIEPGAGLAVTGLASAY